MSERGKFTSRKTGVPIGSMPSSARLKSFTNNNVTHRGKFTSRKSGVPVGNKSIRLKSFTNNNVTHRGKFTSRKSSIPVGSNTNSVRLKSYKGGNPKKTVRFKIP
jgi:hypothetical protein